MKETHTFQLQGVKAEKNKEIKELKDKVKHLEVELYEWKKESLKNMNET